MTKRFIGFDLGAESGRCVVGTLRDGKVTLDEVHRFTTHTVRFHGGFHWDILAIAEEMLKGLVNARKSHGDDFDGIGVDTWGVDYVLVDPEGRVLGYPYHYRDDRTDSIMSEAFAVVPKEALYGNIGVQAVARGIVSGYPAWRRIVAGSFDLKVYRPENASYFDANEKAYGKILNRN
jgi:rhamnulokinase